MGGKKSAGKETHSFSAVCVLSNLSKKKSAQMPLETADTGLLRMRGLMFREKIVPILFIFDSAGIYPIHSFFVPDVFDAIYLSKDCRVTDAFFKIPPGKPLICPKRAAKFLLELPVGISRKLCISKGDILKWKWAKEK